MAGRGAVSHLGESAFSSAVGPVPPHASGQYLLTAAWQGAERFDSALSAELGVASLVPVSVPAPRGGSEDRHLQPTLFSAPMGAAFAAAPRASFPARSLAAELPVSPDMRPLVMPSAHSANLASHLSVLALEPTTDPRADDEKKIRGRYSGSTEQPFAGPLRTCFAADLGMAHVPHTRGFPVGGVDATDWHYALPSPEQHASCERNAQETIQSMLQSLME